MAIRPFAWCTSTWRYPLSLAALLAAVGAASASNPLIEAGLEDPGYANVSQRSNNLPGPYVPGIYLGNQWFLTARHTQNPDAVVLNGEVYHVIDGSNLTLDNPVTLRNVPETTNDPSDLELFRLGLNANGLTPELANSAVLTVGNTDPNRELVIADSTHAVGSDVIAIGMQASSSIGTNDHFGTNVVVSDSNVESGSDSNNDIVTVGIPGGASALTVIVEFDSAGTAASTDFEFQAQSGDSGSPVFVRNALGEFELGGVLTATFSNENGDFTAFLDIGNSQTTYRQQIFALAEDNEYSIAGDVNLDGSVDEADITALAAGWLDEVTEASVLTWARGDLNQDGDTDLADFAILRANLASAATLADLNAAIAAVGGGSDFASIPEPSSGLLALAAAGLLAAKRRVRKLRRPTDR